MAIPPGTRLGVYEVTTLLGEGGMGQVYCARDTRLGRDVALKILPESFASDPDRLMRFEREAKTLASLNHPHIAQIYGIESNALVMELVDGEDLSTRISRGPIPLDEALPIAKQIAEALEAAHDQGIIHRDLKPANIKVRVDGTVKVLDFGLAKALDQGSGIGDQGSGHPANSPTITSPAMTRAGIILGTSAYMSPEQARGRSMDARTDIWAFGCVLFEMLTGRRPFEGETVTDILGAIVHKEPDWSLLPAAMPESLRRILERCLAKDQKQRIRSIADVRLDIQDLLMRPRSATSLPHAAIGELVNPTAVPAQRAPARAVPMLWAVAGAAITALFAIGVPAYRARINPPSAAAVVAQIGAPASVVSAFHEGFALSPDGTTLAFVARGADGVQRLWVRPLDVMDARPLAGTEDATYPFWSPDSTQLAFFVNQKLRRIPLAGGTVQTICDAAGTLPTGSWGDNDVILFGVQHSVDTTIYKVAAAGGAREVAQAHAIRPHWLPNGRGFLYADEGGHPGVYLHADGSESPRQLFAIEGNPDDVWAYTFSRAGYLYVNRHGALTVQRFDLESLSLSGTAVPLSGPAGTPSVWMAASAAADRLVALVPRSADDFGNPGDPLARLRWVNRSGEYVGETGGPARYWSLHLAPDGRRVATNFGDGALFLLDGNRRSAIATAPEGGGENGVWSPDGRAIVYSQIARTNVVRRSLESDGKVEPLPGLRGYVTDWSSDGASLLVSSDATGESRGRDILLYDFASQAARPLLASAANEHHARFSPDGRWVAYGSDASGRSDVLIQPRAGGPAKAISTNGGSHPAWRRDGRELFYLSPNDDMMAVAVSVFDDQLSFGEPKPLFRMLLNSNGGRLFSPYDVSPDGQRFLLNVAEAPQPLLFITGIDRLMTK